jgi:putative ABC transport system permease protein
MENFLQDLRFGLRMLFAHPGFALVALIALTLGIGANTAIFSVVNGVLLKPLPYRQPEKLAMVWIDNRRQGIHEDITSWPNYIDWRDQNRTFEGMAGFRYGAVNLTGQGEPEELRSARVTSNFFPLLGVLPSLGRAFGAEEETQGKDRVAILSHGLWLRRFGGNPSIVNQQISLNGEQVTVVGIMPSSFAFPAGIDLWSPLAIDDSTRTARGSFWMPVIGRIKENVSVTEAQADMKVIGDRLEQQYPINEGYGVNVVPLHEQTVGNLRRSLLVLLGAVAFVLLIACANVANLLLARAAVREREIALRAALGAGRWRIIRQLLTESLVLAVAGGLLGVLVAWWSIDLFVRFSPPDIPRLNEIALDRRVLFFTVGLSLLTGFVFGLVPALQATRWDLVGMLKEGGRGGQSNRAKSIRYGLVVVEIALAVVLLAGAGLLIRSLSGYREWIQVSGLITS